MPRWPDGVSRKEMTPEGLVAHRRQLAAATQRRRRADPIKRAQDQAAVRRYHAAHPEKAAYYRRRRTLQGYALTPAEFEEQRISQGFCCALCEVPERQSRYGKLHVDHDHASGNVRGLLCDHCNIGLGHFRDDPAVLAKARNYLLDPPRKPK